jgi:hypothetical protein
VSDKDAFEAHIKTAAWYRVLSEAAKDDDDGASIFRMARMAASEAWQASRRAALEEAAQLVGSICGNTQYSQKYARECMHKCADAIRALATETNNG